MLLLLKTFYQIVLLRKGPEVIPASPVLFGLTVLFWIVAVSFPLLALPDFGGRDLGITAFNTALSLLIFLGLLLATGKSIRALPTLTAILGCSALITIAIVVWLVVFTPTGNRFVIYLVPQLMLFWSVPVKGHILARALNTHWFVGIAIACVVFVIQYVITISASAGQ